MLKLPIVNDLKQVVVILCVQAWVSVS